MKLTTLSIVALFLLTLSTNVQAFEGDKTFDCPTMKWSELSFTMTESFADERHGFEVTMDMHLGSRDRSSGAGAFTDAIRPVVWGRSFTGLQDTANGGKEIVMEFEGTQPWNTSKMALDFTPAEDGAYIVSLKAIGNSILIDEENGQNKEANINFAYDFFQARWNDIVTDNLHEETIPGLRCTIRQ
ncbi:hypothetical protein GW916_09470 [bacterium]|nr:hypothetical protein [bacterium]